MRYDYEALNPESFQHLCQAVLSAIYPNLQCLPVGQPDGGRDAFNFHATPDSDEFTVFQVKFSRNPNLKTERDLIEEVIDSESEKVSTLVDHGAVQYFLLTNVSGTAHHTAGSIDKTQTSLSANLPIPAQVWWRDDLDRKIDNLPNVKWSYPSIIKATDILPLLASLLSKPPEAEELAPLSRYIATQYNSDKEIKFKQVDLNHDIIHLFIDLPLGRKQADHTRSRTAAPLPTSSPRSTEEYINTLDIYSGEDRVDAPPSSHAGLAASFCLQMPLNAGVTRIVLEGAPGQGKSTVTQFLCQLHRLRFLRKVSSSAVLSTRHELGPARLPFRVDIRDFASWLSGRHPYRDDEDNLLPAGQSRSLESFLAMQVSQLSGGLTLTTEGLLRLLSESHSLIILDGFDEVADIDLRRRLVDEICAAAERFDLSCKSMLIILTSRPAAFANSPGFPESEWHHLKLLDMRTDTIEAYKDKWTQYQNLNADDAKLITSTLRAKLEQPHLRDLARNPMQLTILLQLIHVQGVALPDKRTTLYEEYMKLFFNREAEKAPVVRDHRDLLLSLHGVLAWVLHCQAETGGAGRVARQELRQIVKEYLQEMGHNVQLTDVLFAGTLERVGALVSRLEGTYEFEVQPLREYFAARYLYATAPYSPVGKVRTGTRPERFEALARSFYWTNVTRFFCGFYDAGELSSLVDGMQHLGEERGYGLISRPRNLALMLLSDQVFTQAPKVMRRLVEFITDGSGFYRWAASALGPFGSEIALSVNSGASLLYERCAQQLRVEIDEERSGTLRRVMAALGSRETLLEDWRNFNREGASSTSRLQEAVVFNIIQYLTVDEIRKAAGDDVVESVWALLAAGKQETIYREAKLAVALKDSLFMGGVQPPYWGWRRSEFEPSGALLEILRPEYLAHLAYPEEDGGSNDGLYQHYRAIVRHYSQLVEKELEEVTESDSGVRGVLIEFIREVLEIMSIKRTRWSSSLENWTEIVDRGFSVHPGSALMALLALVSTAVDNREGECAWSEDGFSSTPGLVRRLGYARHMLHDTEWWRERLNGSDDEQRVVLIAMLVMWTDSDVIASNLYRIKETLAAATEGEWQRLWEVCRVLGWARRGDQYDFSGSWFEEHSETLEGRLALLLLKRAERGEVSRAWGREFILRYPDDDPTILELALSVEIGPDEPESEDWSHVDWTHILYLSRRMKQSKARGFLSLAHILQGVIPESVAETVLSESDVHNEVFVTLCEGVYANIVAERAEQVSAVSARDGWFEQRES